MSDPKGYYKVLDLDETASDRDIRKAYTSKIKGCHPDIFPNDKEKLDEYNKLNQAYDALKNEESRKNYQNSQRELFNHSNYQNQAHFADGLFAEFFRGFGETQEANVEYTLGLTLDEAFLGVIKKFKLKIKEKCELCVNGQIKTDKVCTFCKGHGVLYKNSVTGYGIRSVICTACDGKGRNMLKCAKCKGTGKKEVEELVELKIPAGVQNESKIRYKNLIFIVDIKTDIKINWSTGTVYYSITIPLKLAIAGGFHQIKGIDGQIFKIRIPPCLKPGVKMKFADKGYPINNKSWSFFIKGTSRGPLIIECNVNIPPLPESVRATIAEILSKYQN